MKIFKKIVNYYRQKKFVDCANQDFSVTLKPIFGITPNIYITIFFACLVGLILFFILLYPGIKNNGTIVTITSTPSEATIYINDDYRGITPTKIFLKKGKYNIAVKYDGSDFTPSEYQLSGRIFGTLFFPKQKKIHLEAKTIDPRKTASSTLSQFLFLTTYHYFELANVPPPIATQAIKKLTIAESDKNKDIIIEDFLQKVLISANSPELKLDAFNALSYYHQSLLSSYNPKNNSDLQQLYTNIALSLIKFSNTHPPLFFDYYIHIPAKFRKAIKELQAFTDYKEALITYCLVPTSQDFGKPTGVKITRQDKEFIQLRGGLVRLDETSASNAVKKITEDQRPLVIPLLYKFDDFYIATSLVNKMEFDQFIAANKGIEQEWIDANKVNRFYGPTGDNTSVRGISYYAASDYLKFKGWRLPYLCELKALDNATYGLPKISTSYSSSEVDFQHWCKDSYANGYFTDLDFLPEAAIYILSESKNSINSFPKDFCTEVTGFRAAFSKNEAKVVSLSESKEIF